MSAVVIDNELVVAVGVVDCIIAVDCKKLIVTGCDEELVVDVDCEELSVAIGSDDLLVAIGGDYSLCDVVASHVDIYGILSTLNQCRPKNRICKIFST